MGRLLLGAPAAMAGPTRRGASVTVTARAALHSRSPTPPAATRKRAGTCPGRRSPRCCSWRCPGWGPPAWAACPAGERATGQSGTSAARRPHLQLTRTATPPAWMPGHAYKPLGEALPAGKSGTGQALSPGSWRPRRYARLQDAASVWSKPSQAARWTSAPLAEGPAGPERVYSHTALGMRSGSLITEYAEGRAKAAHVGPHS